MWRVARSRQSAFAASRVHASPAASCTAATGGAGRAACAPTRPAAAASARRRQARVSSTSLPSNARGARRGRRLEATTPLVAIILDAAPADRRCTLGLGNGICHSSGRRPLSLPSKGVHWRVRRHQALRCSTTASEAACRRGRQAAAHCILPRHKHVPYQRLDAHRLRLRGRQDRCGVRQSFLFYVCKCSPVRQPQRLCTVDPI